MAVREQQETENQCERAVARSSVSTSLPPWPGFSAVSCQLALPSTGTQSLSWHGLQSNCPAVAESFPCFLRANPPPNFHRKRRKQERISASQRERVTSCYVAAHARRVFCVNTENVAGGLCDMRATTFDCGPNKKNQVSSSHWLLSFFHSSECFSFIVLSALFLVFHLEYLFHSECFEWRTTSSKSGFMS